MGWRGGRDRERKEKRGDGEEQNPLAGELGGLEMRGVVMVLKRAHSPPINFSFVTLFPSKSHSLSTISYAPTFPIHHIFNFPCQSLIILHIPLILTS